MSTPLERMKEYAELETGRRSGVTENYRKYDPDDYKGENEKRQPKELWIKETWHEVGRDSKEIAQDQWRLIKHIEASIEMLDSLVGALPVNDQAGDVLKAEIQRVVRWLAVGPEVQS